MMRFPKIILRYQALPILAGLLLVGGVSLSAAERTVTPECQAANQAVLPASADVRQAFKTLDLAIKRTAGVLKEHGRVIDSLQESRAASKPSVPNIHLNRMVAELNQAQAGEKSAGDRLDQAWEAYRQQFSDLEKKCGGTR